MNGQTIPANPSVIEPIGPAMERVKEVLLRPFDIGKWFAIGLCAWLAQLGEGGLSSVFRLPGNSDGNLKEEAEKVYQQVEPYMDIVIGVAIALAVLLAAVCIVLLWLRCRGRFMFLNSVVRNTDEVAPPWHEFSGEANSLFWFLLVFGIVASVVLTVIAGGTAAAGMTMWHTGDAGRAGAIVLCAVVALLVFMPLAITAAVIAKFTNDFVVPIMYLRRQGWRQAWGEFRHLLGNNKGSFALYILLQIALSMATGALVVVAVCLTCCTAFCLLAIPYIGTVALLPIAVFLRSYSLYYLAQYGPQFDVFVQSFYQDDTVVLDLPS
jgi:hypothetical protein